MSQGNEWLSQRVNCSSLPPQSKVLCAPIVEPKLLLRLPGSQKEPTARLWEGQCCIHSLIFIPGVK